MGLSIVYFKGSQIDISKLICTSVSEYCFYHRLANSADPDEVQHYAAFDFGFHYLFRVSSIQRFD